MSSTLTTVERSSTTHRPDTETNHEPREHNLQGQVTHPATQEQSRFSTFINSRDQASPCEELDRAAANGNGIWEAQILARYQRRMGETANTIGRLVGSLEVSVTRSAC